MKQLKLAITGDLSLTGSFEKKIRNNEEIFSNEILDILNGVDYCICNLEGSVTDSNNYLNPNIKVTSPPNSISYLTKRNIKIYNLANNHTFDCGKIGFTDTINELKNNNCLYFGAWLQNEDINNSIIIGDEINVRLTSFTEKLKHNESSFNLSTSKHLNYQKERKENWNIIFHHGGEEYSLYPSPTKRNYLKKIQKKHTPDFLISHHSHTLQGLEKIGKTNIFYSLGNFIFDIQPHHFYHYTDESAILILTFEENTYQYKLVPIKINRKLGEIELGTNEIIQRFNQISDFSNYKHKWRKDAFRTLIKRIPVPEELVQKEKSLHKKKNFELFFNFKFYTKALKIIFDNNNRSIYWNALIYKLFNKNKK